MKCLRLIICLLFLVFTSLSVVAKGNVSKEKAISISRFDKDFLEYLKAPSAEYFDELLKKHPVLLPAFSQTITNHSNLNNSLSDLRKYFSHPQLKEIYTKAVTKYDDLSSYEAELQKVSDVVKQEFTVRRLPVFSVHVSGFKENVIYISNVISLSIDKYMGVDFPGYQGFFKGYQLQQMQSQMIVRDFVKAWLIADLVQPSTTSGLLSRMIEDGKILYALSALLPEYSEKDLIGYTDAQYQWMQDNEKKIWNTIVDKKQLYSSDFHLLSMYFDESPSSYPFSESPVRAGAYLGLQIVKEYAKRSDQSLDTIMKTNAQTIFKGSKYKP